jgi:cyclopropane fatty-acyl-phospholipid synthase-like methyltransferase
MIRRVYESFLGIPWVFETLRPLAVGGFDFSPAYTALGVNDNDAVLDIGCGAGDALRYIPRFKAYHGFDTDSRAVALFRKRVTRENVFLYERRCEPADMERIAPTKVVLIGLLHHVDDAEAAALLAALSALASVQRVVTLDTVYLPRRPVSNLLARMDRGKFTRTAEQYQELARRANFAVENAMWVHSGLRVATYFGMSLSRATRAKQDT